ncbi:hypothetical protein BC827DRAFT_1273894 [Russula dissimulans]|nr:hypothetical protein BC827DRAFT_1273894 [Russula dissimulans]
MSLSSFSSLSSYSSESDISTLFDFAPFKSSKPSRARRSSPGQVGAGAAPQLNKKQDSGASRSPARPSTRRSKRSVTPTPTPASPISNSSSRHYNRGAVVPYALRSPASKSGVSYSDIDRWRTATISGSDFTYSSGSSITQSTITSSSVFSTSRTRSSRLDVDDISGSRQSTRSTTSRSKQVKAPSVASQQAHQGIHHDSDGICEHCYRPPRQIHGRTDVLPALRLETHSAFLAAYRLSRLSCPDSLEKSTTLDPNDPFTIPPGLSGRPSIPPHLLPELPADERRARRLALLLDSDDPDVRDWAQAEYLKLGRVGRRLVREGVFEVKVTLDGAEENPVAEDWSANEREEDLEKLKERLEREKEKREDHEEVEREMVWAREMFGKWFIDGRVDAVFRLAAEVLNELLKEVARDEGEEWVAEEGRKEEVPKFAEVVPESRDPSSTLGTAKTLGAEQVAPAGGEASAPSVASSKRGGKQRSEPAAQEKADHEPEPPTPPPVADVKDEAEKPAVDTTPPPPAQPQGEASPERSPLPVPVPLPVLHPSIFSEEGLLDYAMNAIHRDPPPELTPPVEPVRPDSQLSSSNQTVTPQDRSPNPAVQHDTYADFYSKDPRRRKTPLLHVKPLPNNQPLPKAEREYDSYADFYANDPRRMRHVDDRPLPTLAKREAAKNADRSSRPQSSKPAKLAIPSKAPVDPPRPDETKHHRRSGSRHRHRHKSPSSFDDFAISSNLSGSSGRLTTPAPSLARSRSRSRERHHSTHRRHHHHKSGEKSGRQSPGLSSPTPSHASRRHRDSHRRRETPPLPVPAPKPTTVIAQKRSWMPFRIQGGAASASASSSNGSPSRAVSPDPIPVPSRGSRLTPTLTMGSGARGEGGALADAVVPPAPPLPPVQFWLPGFPAYKMSQAAHSGKAEGDDRRRRDREVSSASTSTSTSASASVSSASASRLSTPPLPPPVFLALGARRACVPYTPAFQGIDLRVVRPLSAREKLAMRDAVGVLVRLGARVVGAEAGGLGVRGEMWSLSYVGF